MDDLNNVSKETAWQLGYIKGHSDAVRHGKWIMDANENPYIRICSVCGYSRPRMNDHNFYCKTNYCPTCGAKMDLED